MHKCFSCCKTNGGGENIGEKPIVSYNGVIYKTYATGR